MPKLSLKQIELAVQTLRAGGIVVFPTATSYGLAVDATNLEAVKKLYKLKGRGFVKPIHVMVPDLAYAKKIAKFNSTANRLVQAHWPGPITLVLPLIKPTSALRLLSAGSKFIGLRLPDHSIAQSLVNAFGRPITATSANVSGQPEAYTVKQIHNQFKTRPLRPDLFLDAGTLKPTKPSTIIKIDGPHVTLLRQGPVLLEEIINKFQ